MKKRVLSAIALSFFLLVVSCHGKFGAFNAVQSWNGSLGGKWVNSVVHVALWIVPAYELILFGDIIIFNTIEFWTGSNPMAANIEFDGERMLVKVEDRQYELQPAGEESVSVWRDGDHLGVATRTDDGWAWEDEVNGRTLMVPEDDARALVAMLN